MKYILFIGSKIGYEFLVTIINFNIQIEYVFIDKEHDHELETFYKKSMDLCDENRIPKSVNLKKNEIKEFVNSIDNFDYVISVGYRKMIDKDIVNKANIAALGTHFSPLPRYRGFAPLNWVLINGEGETAVNIFLLDESVDSGDIIETRKVIIDYKDDINSLFGKCLSIFNDMLNRVIPQLESNTFKLKQQDNEEATYACARNPMDGKIDWTWDSRRIYNFVRALTYPFPGAYTFINGKRLAVWSCEEIKIPKYEGIIPGKVIKINNKGVVVLCGSGAVMLKKVGMNGYDKNNANEIIKSVRLTLGY